MDSSSRGNTIVAVASLFLALNIITVSARLYTRLFISRTFTFNDGFILICIGLYIALMAMAIHGVALGIGSHTFSVLLLGLPNIEACLKTILILQLLYVLLTSIMKSSIALTLHRFTHSTPQRYFLYIILAINAIICLVVFFFTLFQCSPVSFQWMRFSGVGTCMSGDDFARVGYALCAVTIVLDLFFLGFPLWLVRGREVGARVKWCVGGLLVLGVIASIANIVRLAALAKLAASVDQLYDAADVFTWSITEISIGFIVANLLELAPLLRRWGVRGFSDESHATFEVMSADVVRLDDVDKSRHVASVKSVYD